VRASSDENADLFWGLRGGGGNFGVVTGFDYALHDVGPEMVGGVVAWPVSEARGMLALYRELAEQAPPELTLVTLIRPAPAAPCLPKEWHLKPIGAVLPRRTYVQMQSLLDATQPTGRRYYWKSEYLPARRTGPV
jgi:hypothetical protein